MRTVTDDKADQTKKMHTAQAALFSLQNQQRDLERQHGGLVAGSRGIEREMQTLTAELKRKEAELTVSDRELQEIQNQIVHAKKVEEKNRQLGLQVKEIGLKINSLNANLKKAELAVQFSDREKRELEGDISNAKKTYTSTLH